GRDHVGNGKSSTRFEHAESFVEDALLLRGEIDYAVRDNHIDAVVRDWQRFYFTQPKLNICESVLLRVFPCLAQHFMCHVDTNDLAGGSDCTSSEETVESSARSQIEDQLTFSERGNRQGISAAEAKVRSFRCHR